MPARKNQETRVGRDQMKPVVLDAEIPADPAIPCATFERRRGKAQQRHGLRTPPCPIPDRLTDLWQSPKIMMSLHQAPERRFVVRRNRLHDDLGPDPYNASRSGRKAL